MRGCGPCPFRCPSGRQNRRPIPHPCWAAVLVAVLVAGLGAVQGGAHETVQSWAPHLRKGSPPTRLHRRNPPNRGLCLCLACCASVLASAGGAVQHHHNHAQQCVAARDPRSRGGLAFAVRGPVTRWRPPRGRGILRRCGDGLLFGGGGGCAGHGFGGGTVSTGGGDALLALLVGIGPKSVRRASRSSASN